MSHFSEKVLKINIHLLLKILEVLLTEWHVLELALLWILNRNKKEETWKDERWEHVMQQKLNLEKRRSIWY